MAGGMNALTVVSWNVRGLGDPLKRTMVEEVGLTNLRRSRNPGERQFLCFSKSHMSLSLIDLCLCSDMAVQLVAEIKYALMGISDHSPLVLSLEVRPPSTLLRAP